MDPIKYRLRESLNITDLINVALLAKNSNNHEWGKKYVNNFLDVVKQLPNEIKLYRVVFVNSIDDINRIEIGAHYSPNKRKLEQSHSSKSHVGGGKPYLLTIKVNKSLIDLSLTLENNIKYPHENEITLLNNGVGAKIINIEDFNPSDEFNL